LKANREKEVFSPLSSQGLNNNTLRIGYSSSIEKFVVLIARFWIFEKNI
jgi:hypothetical protein